MNVLHKLLSPALVRTAELKCSARRLPGLSMAAVLLLVGAGLLKNSDAVALGAAPGPVTAAASNVSVPAVRQSVLRNEVLRQPVDTIRRPGLTALFEAKLRRDGLLKAPLKEYTLTTQRFVVNGRPQSAAVAAEYRALYEATMGQPLLPDQSFTMRKNADQPIYGQPAIRPNRAGASGNTSAKKPAAGAKAAPQKIPFPPLSPSDMRQQQLVVLHEMQANGLLKSDEKEAQLVFLDHGLTINGRPQPAAVATRYRELLRVPIDGSSGQVSGPARITIHE
jgi:hypothetical protein